ncbi:MAG: thioredoxin [Lachnotalea sp.]
MGVLKVTKSNFEKEVMNSDRPVLLDFWASWCGPCKMIAPTIEEVASEAGHLAKVCKINVDEEQELAQKFKIMSIPTLVSVKNGKVVQSEVGAKSKQSILNMIQ